MSDVNKQQRAKAVYDTLCAAIEARDWTYRKEEEKLLVFFGVNGKDLPMRFIMTVDVGRQLIRLLSPLPFEFSDEKRVEAAVATTAVNFLLADGSFDLSLQRGACWFRLTASFAESDIGEGLFQHMISYSCVAVDAFNDRLEALAKGEMSLSEFLKVIEP